MKDRIYFEIMNRADSQYWFTINQYDADTDGYVSSEVYNINFVNIVDLFLGLQTFITNSNPDEYAAALKELLEESHNAI